MIIRLPSIRRGVVGAAVAMLLCLPAAAQNCQSELATVNDLQAKTRDLARVVRQAEAEADRMMEVMSDTLLSYYLLAMNVPEPDPDYDHSHQVVDAYIKVAQIMWRAYEAQEQRRQQAAAAGLIALRQYTNMRALLLEARLKFSECQSRIASAPPTPPVPGPPAPPAPPAGGSGDGQICTVTYRGFSSNEGPRTSTMVVSPGHACSRTVGLREGLKLTGVVVTSAPRNGRATVSGFTVTYRSNEGFRGRDTFTTTVHAINVKGNSKNAMIIWDVTVR